MSLKATTMTSYKELIKFIRRTSVLWKWCKKMLAILIDNIYVFFGIGSSNILLKIVLKWLRVERKTNSLRCHVQFCLDTGCHFQRAMLVWSVLSSYNYCAIDVLLYFERQLYYTRRMSLARQSYRSISFPCDCCTDNY